MIFTFYPSPFPLPFSRGAGSEDVKVEDNYGVTQRTEEPSAL